jgi:6-phosphogluconate dehydrogenase
MGQVERKEQDIMKLAVIGLGKTSLCVVRRLIARGHEVKAYDSDPDAARQVEDLGLVAADSLGATIEQLDGEPRFVWIMLPAGERVSATLQTLALLLKEDDVIMECSGSYYKQSMERATMLSYKGIHMLDVGVSGGAQGEHDGFNLMVGGDEQAFDRAAPIFQELASADGYRLVGPSGAGHYAQMVHHGIEYGMMQSIVEGFELMSSKDEFDFDLAAMAQLWNCGSTIRSRLLELAGRALEADANLDWVEPEPEDTGGGCWAVQEALEMEVPLPVITLSLQTRYRSQQKHSYAARLLAALRGQYDEPVAATQKGR